MGQYMHVPRVWAVKGQGVGRGVHALTSHHAGRPCVHVGDGAWTTVLGAGTAGLARNLAGASAHAIPARLMVELSEGCRVGGGREGCWVGRGGVWVEGMQGESGTSF